MKPNIYPKYIFYGLFHKVYKSSQFHSGKGDYNRKMQGYLTPLEWYDIDPFVKLTPRSKKEAPL